MTPTSQNLNRASEGYYILRMIIFSYIIMYSQIQFMDGSSEQKMLRKFSTYNFIISYGNSRLASFVFRCSDLEQYGHAATKT